MLSVKRPTSTTVLYTVSTKKPTTHLTTRAATLGLIFMRAVAGIFVATLLLREYQRAFDITVSVTSESHSYQTFLIAGPWADLTTFVFHHTTRSWRLLISLATLWLIFRKSYTEESLLMIRGLGVQTSTSSPSYLWTSSTRFIPASSIQDIFIHEAFNGFEVRFYLSIAVEGESSLVVVFPNILPRREILEDVWRGARACLYEPRT